MMREDPFMAVSFLTELEIAGALARRKASLDARREAVELFRSLEAAWTRVDDYDPILLEARDVIRTYGLRSGDAIQLASAIIACRHRPATLTFVTNDIDLRAAARAEGFPTLP